MKMGRSYVIWQTPFLETVAWLPPDALGRITTHVTPLGNPNGTFSISYIGATPRLYFVNYPNGQFASFSYWNNSQDQRLSRIYNGVGSVRISEDGNYYDT